MSEQAQCSLSEMLKPFGSLFVVGGGEVTWRDQFYTYGPRVLICTIAMGTQGPKIEAAREGGQPGTAFIDFALTPQHAESLCMALRKAVGEYSNYAQSHPLQQDNKNKFFTLNPRGDDYTSSYEHDEDADTSISLKKIRDNFGTFLVDTPVQVQFDSNFLNDYGPQITLCMHVQGRRLPPYVQPHASIDVLGSAELHVAFSPQIAQLVLKNLDFLLDPTNRS